MIYIPDSKGCIGQNKHSVVLDNFRSLHPTLAELIRVYTALFSLILTPLVGTHDSFWLEGKLWLKFLHDFRKWLQLFRLNEQAYTFVLHTHGALPSSPRIPFTSSLCPLPNTIFISEDCSLA